MGNERKQPRSEERVMRNEGRQYAGVPLTRPRANEMTTVTEKAMATERAKSPTGTVMATPGKPCRGAAVQGAALPCCRGRWRDCTACRTRRHGASTDSGRTRRGGGVLACRGAVRTCCACPWRRSHRR